MSDIIVNIAEDENITILIAESINGNNGVTSVNGILPDETGALTLDILSAEEKAELTGGDNTELHTHSYNNLEDKPTIPSALSQLTGDEDHRTVTDEQIKDWDGKQAALGFTPENSANKKLNLTDNSDIYYVSQKAVKTAVDAKQDTLVNTVNIKSINGETILGDGDLPVTATSDNKVKYNVDDPTAGYIADKFVAGTNISLAEGTGANENKLVITNSQDISGKENVGVASGLIGTHESTYNHSLIATALQTDTDIQVNSILFDLTPEALEPTTGQLYWDENDKTLSLVVDGGEGVTNQIGQETHIRVVNKTGVDILNGSVVYVNDAQGNRPTIALAQANSYLTSCIIGVVTHDIGNNNEGYVTINGIVRNFDTSDFDDGDMLFLSPSIAGGLINTVPTSPNNVVVVGVALNSTENGSILVVPKSPLSADTAFTDNTDRIAPTQKAVKYQLDLKELLSNKENSTIDTSTTKYPTINLLKTARDSRKYWHGIESAGALSFNDTEHILTIASGTNTYWYKGTKYTTSSTITCDLDSYVTLTDNTLYYIYFEDATGTLKASEDFWDLKEKVPVATVIWNGSIGAVQNELHGYMRDLDWHINAHLTIGARYYTGLSQTLPSTAVDNQIQIEAGVIYDEDIRINIDQQTNARHFYQASSGVYTFVNSDLPYVNNAGTVQYLRTSDYTLQNVGASNFVNMWVYASDDIERNIYIIPTQATSAFNTINLARAETPPSLNGLNITPELKLIYRWTYKGDGEYQEAVDYRQSSSLPAGGSASTTASTVTFTPTGNISSTNVQSAITELDTEKEPILTGASVKNTIADNDRFIQLDSEATNATKYNLFSLVKSTLKTYFDGLYNAILTFGIANTNALKVDDASVADNDYAKFTANGLEGQTYAEVKSDLSLNNVENTALSTWAGSSNITTLGTVTSGTLSTGAVIGGATVTLGSDATGDLYYRNASGVLTRLAIGTSSQYLKGGTIPSWDTPSGGGATLWTAWTGASRTSDAVISSTTHLAVGTAIRYKATGGTYRYGKVLSLSTDAHSILGYPCTTSDDDVFEYDSSGLKSETFTIHLADNFNDADDDALLLNDLNMKLGFRPALCGEFYLVGITTVCKSADTSSDPDINIVQFGTTNKIFSADVNTDLARATSANTVEVTNNYYQMNLDSSIDISVDKVGAGDAYDADVELHFVRA